MARSWGPLGITGLEAAAPWCDCGQRGQGPCHVLDGHGDLSQGFWLMPQAGGGLFPSRSGRHQHLPP